MMREGNSPPVSTTEAAAKKEPTKAYLTDAWAQGGQVPLDGWLERHQFGPVLMAFLALILALILFQVVLAPIATLLLLVMQGVPLGSVLSDLERIIEQHAQALITANTIGQILGIAVPALVLAWLHTSRPDAFLRLRPPNFVLLGLGVVGLVFLLPIVQWLGTINEWLPLPEFIRAFDESQMELVARVLGSDLGVWFSLVMLAVTPALCEEVLFRGYVQRQLERGMGILAGILLSGFVFGLYHLRLTQLLPLSALGIYMAYLAWRTGSLWVPIVVHFANNAFAVALAAWVRARPDLDIDAIEQLEVPWYFIVVGALFFGLTLVSLQRHARQVEPALPPTRPSR